MRIPGRLFKLLRTHLFLLITLAVCAAGFFTSCRSGDPPPSAKEDDGGRTIEESYGFSLDAGGELVFTAVEEDSGYKAESFDVTISNTGSVQTGLVQIALSGDDMDKFTLTPASIDDIAVSGSETFTVSTTTELPAGEYTASVTVSGADGFQRSFDIRFNVYVPTIIPVEFTAISADGAAQTTTTTAISFTLDTEIDITIDNISLNDGGTGAVKGDLSGGTGGTWSLTVSGITSEGEVTVNLTKDRHTFSGTNTVAVHYHYTYGLRVVSGATLEFPEAFTGYTTAPAGKVVTVENTGNQPLSGVAVTVGQRYEATPASTGIAAGASASFTIKPKANLAAGTYNESLAVGTSTTNVQVMAKFTVRNGNVTADTIVNGTMTLSHTTAAPNTTITVTITPAKDYAVKPSTLALIPATAVTFTPVNAVQFRFPMPAGKDVKVGVQLIKPIDNKMATGGNSIQCVQSADGTFDEVHVFTSNGTLNITRAPAAKAQLLVVAGGGGGGRSGDTVLSGGGGGAGGLVMASATLTAVNYSATVGAGGTGGTINAEAGYANIRAAVESYNGKNSTFSGPGFTTITANGGGGGGWHFGNNGVGGGNGGSGGGGSGSGGSADATDPLQGKNGAAYGPYSTGGGGGYSGAGTATSGSSNGTGTGGAGISKANIPAAAGVAGVADMLAKGGDGGSKVAGPANTGNGGGGGNDSNGAAGGSGIIVVRFPWVSP